jgi:hypothetical protein
MIERKRKKWMANFGLKSASHVLKSPPHGAARDWTGERQEQHFPIEDDNTRMGFMTDLINRRPD